MQICDWRLKTRSGGRKAAGGAAAEVAGDGFEVLHDGHGREQLADLVGEVGVAGDVLVEVGLLALAESFTPLLGQLTEKVKRSSATP